MYFEVLGKCVIELAHWRSIPRIEAYSIKLLKYLLPSVTVWDAIVIIPEQKHAMQWGFLWMPSQIFEPPR
jgi:hypothetical protein